ncbi:MAG TPA: pentapeptide repeat-containing protein [Pyrinomonadaceae bacterium]|nr:pentapeptide repeat-containing protein [Pyrinomonadaceae bacterium]
MLSPFMGAPLGVCNCDWLARSACAGEPLYREHDGKHYCVFHFPGTEKSAPFYQAMQRKLSRDDYNFSGVFFPDPVFFTEDFKKVANFSSATFRQEANFATAVFNEGADFSNVTFKAKATFFNVTFKADAIFNYTVFNDGADFTYSTFEAMASFLFTVFKDQVRFAGDTERKVFSKQSWLNLQESIFEKPERVALHTLTLRPHFFLSVDARKFEFINVEWSGSLGEEIEKASAFVSSPHRLLSITCRQLAVNAEENHRYEEASRFRYMAMNARRLESHRGFAPWQLSWWYWLASGYGERIPRAIAVLIGLWLLFALLYTQVGFVRWEPRRSNEKEAMIEARDEVGEPLNRPRARALTYSLGVMMLQKPEPRPATMAAQGFVILETILGLVQAALIALAIRRKFMR